MANRYMRPVMFAFEPDVVLQYSKISFGATGAPTIDTNQSKGICSVVRSTQTSPGTTTSSSASVTAATSLDGVYNGMTVTGTGIQAGTTVSSVNPVTGTLTLSQTATASGTVTLTFVGGQYTVTFGAQFSPARLDSYVKLLGLQHNWDESTLTAALSGTTPASPAAPAMFLVANNISNALLANLVIQFGTFSGATFTAADPANGDIVRLAVQLCRSTAI